MIEPFDELDVRVARRPQVQHAQLVLWRQVGRDEAADVAGAADEQDLHTEYATEPSRRSGGCRSMVDGSTSARRRSSMRMPRPGCSGMSR